MDVPIASVQIETDKNAAHPISKMCRQLRYDTQNILPS